MTKISPRVKLWLTALGFGLPPVWSLFNKLNSGKAAFRDYEAVACAGLRHNAGQSLYPHPDLFKCDALNDPTSFVYLPAVAEGAGHLIASLGLEGFFSLYTAIYILSAAFILLVVFASPTSDDSKPSHGLLPALPGTWKQRWPFLGFAVGSALAWGNIAVISHALVLLGALFLGRTVIPFILLVALTALIKPVFLVYLSVLLLLDRPLWQRITAFGAGALIGLWPVWQFAITGGALAQEWRDLLAHFLYRDAGHSYYGWLKAIGLDGRTPIASAGYVVLAAALCLSAFAFAEGLKLKTYERIWLGLALSVLLIPRLMPQDIFLMGPGLILISLKLGDLEAPHPWLVKLRNWGPSFVFYVCLMALLGNYLDFGGLTNKLATLIFSAYMIIAGWMAFHSRREAVLSPLPFLKLKAG